MALSLQSVSRPKAPFNGIFLGIDKLAYLYELSTSCMNDHGFREAMSQMTNDELLDVLENKRDQYQEIALLDAEAILSERGVAYNVPESDQDEASEAGTTYSYQKREYIFLPLIIGVLMVLVAILPAIEVKMSRQEALQFNIASTVILRIISIVWIISLAKRFGVNKPLWIILTILFGGWSLIAMNIVSWFQPDSKEYSVRDKSIRDDVILQDDTPILTEEELKNEQRNKKTVGLITKIVLILAALFIAFRIIQHLLSTKI